MERKSNTPPSYALEILSEEEEERMWAGEEEASEFHSWKQWLVAASLLLLFLGLLSAYILLIAVSHQQQKADDYSYFFTTVILLSELGKLAVSLLLALLSRYAVPVLSDSKEATSLLLSPKKSLHFAIPAFLYSTSVSVLFLSLLRLDPSSFQLLSQVGIGFVALFTRLLLRRALDRVQWLSLLILAVGTQLTQLDSNHLHFSLSGLLLTLLYSGLDALATVYTEFRLKQDKDDCIHVQNVHLFFYSSCWSALLFFLLHFRSTLGSGGGFFTGYNSWTFALVGCLAAAGLVSHVILKLQSSIARMFCVSGAILVTAAVSGLILHFRPTLLFAASFVIVVCAALLYRHRDMMGLRFLLQSEEYELYSAARVEELNAFPHLDEEDKTMLSTFAD